jgi:dipeptidase E
MQILALSSSRAGGGGYLQTALPLIRDFLGSRPLSVAFVPFAAVDRDYDRYTTMVREALASLPLSIQTADHHNGKEIVQAADVIMVGGGNTFKLLHDIYDAGLFELMRDKVVSGTSYIGWSAGSNVAGATIRTTNDMPIIEPRSFTSFNFFPFQVNPHYINQNVEGFHGETRDQRLTEFVMLNPGVPVVGLPEGTALLLQEDQLVYKGAVPGVMFRGAREEIRSELEPGADLSALLKR